MQRRRRASGDGGVRELGGETLHAPTTAEPALSGGNARARSPTAACAHVYLRCSRSGKPTRTRRERSRLRRGHQSGTQPFAAKSVAFPDSVTVANASGLPVTVRAAIFASRAGT